MAKKAEYEIQGVPIKISATSRASLKILVRGRENFYTVEASEERTIADGSKADMQKEWSALFDELNDVVDYQCEEIAKTFKE